MPRTRRKESRVEVIWRPPIEWALVVRFPRSPLKTVLTSVVRVRLVAVARSQSIEEEDRKKQEMKR